ncbi:hypothetical protein L21SP2_2399 [Salinispira pacifica]|uniref:Uncharacterized protein n=1 Tax=Salinispira pacifica TaxID=1307761 RepID=V5WIT4_9SPIO|nr:hypothetical protein L21SP2_2399 [Salinispira pacifica]
MCLYPEPVISASGNDNGNHTRCIHAAGFLLPGLRGSEFPESENDGGSYVKV